MRILFTGASSFTGCWFVKELAAAGHELFMPFQRGLDQYDGIRRLRVDMVRDVGHPVFRCSFGDQRFMELIEQESTWDMLCHHAADVTNYRSADFDAVEAARNNTRNLRTVLAKLAAKCCAKVLLTGTVFEDGEGAGSAGLRAFSPYGLSKSLTAKVFEFYTREKGLQLGKFVIPNPFGPYEEPRFLNYLIQAWHKGDTPSVRTPDYIRDNIPVSLLARAYLDFVTALPTSAGFCKVNPSGYLESQGSFALRVAASMRERLGLRCDVELMRQVEFAEPHIRINTDVLDRDRLGWNESHAWDELAEYYRRAVASESPT